MEGAFTAINGYEKLNHHRTHKRLMILAVLLLTLVIGLLLASLIIHDSADTEQEYQQQQLDSAVEWIKTVCIVTQNPVSCFTTALSSFNISTIKLDPEVVLKLSLQLNIKELENITYFIRILYETHPEVALRDCMDQMGDALSRLNDSLSKMEGEINPTFTRRKVRDIETWVNAAMTDEVTCLDGLDEMGSMVADEVKSKMKMSNELLSYTLAIIANLQNLYLRKFGLIMH